MGTPARQIGWSTEANLLHAILRQLDQLAGVISVSGGGGGGGGSFVTTDTVQPITALKNFTVVAGPAATFTSSTGNTVNVTATTGSGVYSTSVDGPAIEGFSVNDPGIFGYSSNEPGVFSHSQNSVGFIVDSLNAANLSDLAHFRSNGTPVAKISKAGQATVNGLVYTRGVDITNQDLDLLFNAGFYSGNILLNAPSNTFYYITVERFYDSEAWTLQTAKGFGGGLFDGKIYTRTRGNSTWQPWTQVVTTTSLTDKLTLKASTTLAAVLNIPVGPAPTTPVDGDIWLESNTLTGLKIRLGGVTRTITIT
jgi:hypothetical protein